MNITDDLLVRVIQEEVAAYFHLKVGVMWSKRRPGYIAWPRQVAMALCREQTELSLVRIGEFFGNRDHGTVLCAARHVKNVMELDAGFRTRLLVIKTRIAGRCEESTALEVRFDELGLKDFFHPLAALVNMLRAGDADRANAAAEHVVQLTRRATVQADLDALDAAAAPS